MNKSDERDERDGPNGEAWWISNCARLSHPPTGRYFYPPHPPIASQSISRNVPVAREDLPILSTSL